MLKKKIRFPLWVKIILSLIAAVLLTGYYIRIFYVMGIDSDYSNLLLEAKDIISGNIFLNGWTQTGISFLTTDLLFYLIAVLVKGVTRESYWVASGLMTACMFFSALPLLKMGKKQEFKLTEWIVFCGICAFPSLAGANLLRAHTGVYIWIFLAIACFYKIYQEESEKKIYYVLFALSIVLGCIGDAIIYIVLIAPVFLICLRDLLLNQPQKKKRSLCVIGVTVGAVILGTVIEKIYYFLGTANKNSFLEIKVFEDFSNYPAKFCTYLHAVLGLNHADFTQQKLVSLDTFFFFVSVLLVVFGYIIMAIHIREFVLGKKTDIISQVLSLGFFLISVIFIITNVAVDINSARYIGSCSVIFAILIVRYMRIYKIFSKRFASEKISCRIVAIVLGGALLVHNFIPLSDLPLMSSEQERVTAVLQENNLKRGYANFWDSSVVTVLSKSKVKIRPISIIESVNALGWGSKDSWYKEKAEFVLVRTPEWDGSGVTYENVVSQFGEPERIIEFENYKVFIYGYDISKKIQGVNSATR